MMLVSYMIVAKLLYRTAVQLSSPVAICYAKHCSNCPQWPSLRDRDTIIRETMTAAADPAAPGAEAPPAESAGAAAVTDGNNVKMGSTDGDDVPLVAATKAEGDKNADDLEEDDDDASEGGAGSADSARAQKKRKERLEQNRISARESRKRKKTMIEELQRTVITLSKENKDLNERNEQLRSQLVEIGRKVRSNAVLTVTPVLCTLSVHPCIHIFSVPSRHYADY
jgi:hypothetical protein